MARVTAIALSPGEWQDFAWAAFGYAVGRQTGIAHVVAEGLTVRASTLDRGTREAMIRELDERVREGGKAALGAPMDQEAWRKLREALSA
jgi:hypothetical protein